MVDRAGLVLRAGRASSAAVAGSSHTRTGEAGAAIAGPVLAHSMKRISVLAALAGVALLTVPVPRTDRHCERRQDRARCGEDAEAADYAPAALAAAETASAALDAELKAQSEKFALTRSYIRRRQNWGLTKLQDKSKRDCLLLGRPSGIKVARNLNQAVVWERGNLSFRC